MHNIVISLISFTLSIAFLILTIFITRTHSYVDSDTDKKCTDMHGTNLNNGDNCGVWDGTSCRKGLVVNGFCTSKASYLPLILLILTGVSFLSFIIFLILYFRQ